MVQISINRDKFNLTYGMLYFVYALVPIVIGIDKLTTWWLVNWLQYTSPTLTHYLGISANMLIYVTAIIEILAGIIVFVRPRLGGYLIFGYMILVIIDLASMNRFYDIIARDAVIALGALALAWLTEAKEQA